MSGAYFDALETRDPEQRQRQQSAELSRQVAHAKANSPYFKRLLAEVDAAEVTDLAALAKLPVTRKSDLKALQAAERPFGGIAAWPMDKIGHIYQSPGPIYEPEAWTPDHWRVGRALWALGMRPGTILHNSFSYHLTPAGMMYAMGAQAVGCPIFPGGTGNTELQIQAMADLRAGCYAGTPSFLKVLLEKAAESGLDVSALRLASVGGEALPPSLRNEIKGHGVFTLQTYITAELGLIAYESPAMEGMILDEGVLVEIVRPGSGDPVPDGEVGEILVTTFSPVYPVIRFATGDLSAVLPGQSPCGRTNRRIRGWMGRADQTTKIKGMFVHASQVNQVVARHPEILKARLVVESRGHLDEMTLRCEAREGGAALAGAIAATMQSVCKLKGRVEFVTPGSLPNDGKVIADDRKYE